MYTFLNLAEIAGWDRFELESVCRAQAQSAYLGDHVGLCRLLARYKFYVDTRDSGFGSHVLLDGFWEMWLTQFMARFVKPGWVAVDVGANYGYFSLLLADLVGPDGHLFAIEPNPKAAASLLKSLNLNGFSRTSTVLQAAAGAGDGGELRLFIPREEPKNALIVGAQEVFSEDAGVVETVPRRTLDAILADQASVDFLKIDAEGAEEGIFEGMQHILRKHRPAIVLEFNAARYSDPKGFLATIKEHYPVLRYIDHGGDPAAVDSEVVAVQNFGEDWLLFLHND